MKKLSDHIVNELNEKIIVTALDQPDHGASHEYAVEIPEAGLIHTIRFQKGPINEAGVNGISNEALMTIVIDRLRGFQSGDLACRETALALTKLEESLLWLNKRTRERLERGVEGTHKA
jgi:hypothetical protein